MNGAHLVSQGRAWLCSLAPAGNPIYCPIGHHIWGPLGKQDVCPNFALTAAKFVFSNSGNFRAKAIPPSPGLALNAHSGNERGKIPVLTGPKQQKFNEMNWAHLASQIRGELGYAHWPQLGTQFIALLGTKFGAH